MATKTPLIEWLVDRITEGATQKQIRGTLRDIDKELKRRKGHG